MIWIGIDPGLQGAVAVMFPIHGEVFLHDTPVGRVGTKRQYLLKDMGTLLEYSIGEVTVVLEAVTAMPGQGVTSMFNMGRGLGLWEGICAAKGIPVRKVRALEWKRHFGFIGQGKDAPRVRAQQEYPDLDLSLKKHQGRADALYLARYGLETWGTITEGDSQ